MKNFVFIHVPKCGGTTVIKNLQAVLPEKVGTDDTYRLYRRYGVAKFPESHNRNIPEWYQKEMERYTVIAGHFTREKWKHLGWPFVSMIRDPVERVISYYSVWFFVNKETDVERLKRKGWGIREFARYSCNQMTQMLGENLDSFLFVGIQEKHRESLERIGELFEIRFPKDPRHFNWSRKKIKVSKKDRQYIEEVNKEDRKLYNKVIMRFHK